MKQPVDALLALYNRSLDEQMRSLVARFGADAVRASAKRVTAKKRGRKAEKDWVGLKPWVSLDVEDWIHGRDPFAIRSNYAIAKAYAEQNPGYNIVATNNRIERKLRELRRWMMLQHARIRSETECPLETYIRASRELVQLDPESSQFFLEHALGRLARYRERFGEPAPEKTLQQLEDELKAPVPTILGGGGLLGRYLGS